ncbi:MAG: chalcone isomerase family protein [Gallionella sp.]|nr:chalcone isomerase family protein [Gallionella sp.]
MKKILLIVTLLFLSVNVSAKEVAGVKLADTVQLGGSSLMLNGAGIRTKIIFKVYVAALYATQKQTAAAAILADNNPQRVSLHMLRELSDEKLLGAFIEAIEANHTPAELSALSSPLKQMADIFHQVKEVQEGDVITLDYMSGGTQISMNGTPRGTIAGEAFHRALLKIWLGNKPVQDDLKKSLLGG